MIGTVSRRPPSAISLAAVLAGGAVAHAVVPEVFDEMIPERLPGPARAWTLASGAAELAVAAAVAAPRTRRTGGLAAAVLFVAVLPGNVTMALSWSDRPPALRAAAWCRLPLQIPLVLWALAVRRQATTPS